MEGGAVLHFAPGLTGPRDKDDKDKVVKTSVDPAAVGGSCECKGRGRAKTRALSSRRMANTGEERAVARALGHRHKHCDATVGAERLYER